MPRLRLRRLLLSLAIFAGFAFLVLNFPFALLNNGSGVKLEQPDEQSPGRGPRESFVTGIVRPGELDVPGVVRPPDEEVTGPFEADPLYDFRKVRPWFMPHGKLRPTSSAGKIWPEEDIFGDKIVNQLMYARPTQSDDTKLKKILLFFGRGGWNDLPMGRDVFLRDKCPVDTCELTTDTKEAESADAVFFKDRFSWPKHRRHPDQVWILFLLECPRHTQGFGGLTGVFNWTATYRHDSDLVAPYEKWVPYDSHLNDLPPPSRNFLQGKSKMVAWFVSNCAARNQRMQYARELNRHIGVDIYGSCGPKRCPRNQASRCFEMLDKDYRFYLAFENSNCKDYITEKFFVNGLSRNVIPIVMGARPEDYKRSSPRGSYIHVEDFESPEKLAEHLKILASNETMYNEYFRWKGTGEFINTYFWCRLCALLHAKPERRKAYEDVQSWWAGKGTCVAARWKENKLSTP